MPGSQRANRAKRSSGPEKLIDMKIDELSMRKAESNNTKVPIPPILKATIRFGYNQDLKEKLESKGTNFEEWIEGVFTHTQAQSDPFVFFDQGFCCFMKCPIFYSYMTSKKVPSKQITGFTLRLLRNSIN